MQVAETKTSSAAHKIIQKKRQPFFNREGQDSFFSKSTEHQNSFFSPATIQPKLSIGQPNDKYEVEADAMADKVLQRLASPSPQAKSELAIQAKPLASSITPLVQRKCTACEQENKKSRIEEEDIVQESPIELQRKPIFESNADPPDEENNIQQKCESCNKAEEGELYTKSDGSGDKTTTASLESRLKSTKGGGSALPEDIRTQMESSFGTNFSGVRIHTNNSSVQMNKELSAQAFTHGSDIYFNAGKYDPETTSGKHLLAHELTHTVQQGGSGGKAQKKIQGWPDWADSAANWVADTASSAASGVADGVAWVGGQVADGAAWVGDKISSGAAWVGDQVSAAAQWVMEQLNGAIDTGTEFLNEKWEKIEDFGISAFEDIKNGFSNLASFITSPMTMMILSLSNMNADLLEGAWNILKAGGGILKSGITAVVNGVLSAGEAIWETISGFIDGIFETIDGLFDNTAFNLLPNSLKSGIRSAFNGLRSLWNKVSSFWRDLWERLTSFAREILSAVQNFIENVITYGIAKVISMVRGLKEVYDYVNEFFADPEGTIAPFVEGIAAMINEQGPGKSEEIGNRLTNENYPGGGFTSADNGVVQREVLDGEERTTATLSEVLEGVIYYIADAWDKLDILGMLWKTFKDMFWPPATIRAIFDQFSQLWNDDWATAYNSLYMPRNFLESPFGCLHDLWSNYLILLDFPLALWRTLNNIVGLLMGYVTIIVVLVEAIAGAIVGSAAGGVGAVPGFFIGAKAGLATMAPVGLALMASIVGVEANTVGVILMRLFTANQVCEKRQVDIKTSVASFVTMAVALILALLMALLAKFLSMIAEFLKGTSRGVTAPMPVPEPVPASGQPVPQPGQPRPVLQPVQPAPQPVPQGPQPLTPNVVPFPGNPQTPVPGNTPMPVVSERIAAKFEDNVNRDASSSLVLDNTEEVTVQKNEVLQKEMEAAPSIQTARMDDINPEACDEDDDCENFVIPGFAPQDKISHEHARRNGGASLDLTSEVTGVRKMSGYKKILDYKGNNIAGFIYEVYESESDYRRSEPSQVETIVSLNDDIHSEERIVSELLEIKRRLPRSFIIKIDQIATERSACDTCHGIIRGNPDLRAHKIYSQSSGIYYIVKYHARNWKKNAEGLRAAYCGSTTKK